MLQKIKTLVGFYFNEALNLRYHLIVNHNYFLYNLLYFNGVI